MPTNATRTVTVRDDQEKWLRGRPGKVNLSVVVRDFLDGIIRSGDYPVWVRKRRYMHRDVMVDADQANYARKRRLELSLVARKALEREAAGESASNSVSVEYQRKVTKDITILAEQDSWLQDHPGINFSGAIRSFLRAVIRRDNPEELKELMRKPKVTRTTVWLTHIQGEYVRRHRLDLSKITHVALDKKIAEVAGREGEKPKTKRKTKATRKSDLKTALDATSELASLVTNKTT